MSAPDAALEAAAYALYSAAPWPAEWHDAEGARKDTYLHYAHLALEGAAPYMTDTHDDTQGGEMKITNEAVEAARLEEARAVIAAYLDSLASDAKARGDIGKDGGLEAWDYLTWKAEQLRTTK